MKRLIAILGIAASSAFGQTVVSGVTQGADSPVQAAPQTTPAPSSTSQTIVDGIAADPYAFGTEVWTTGDLGNNVINDAGDFSVFPDLNNPDNSMMATLTVKYGLWNSPDVPVDCFVNGNFVGSFVCDQGYINPGPEFIDFDVAGLLQNGMNEVLFTGNNANIGDYVIGQVDLEYSPSAGNDCGLVKEPDQGPFWQPLGPDGSYVYANSFVPCNDGEVSDLGMWLLDLSGTGGPDVRFEIWGSIGGNPANGPDAGNVLAGTGSLSFNGTNTLEFYSAPTTFTTSLSGGTTYWFVATCVGEDGAPADWQVGAHTQNSGGINDNGTFWFSNDPNGVNFDGQGFTPEMAFSVEQGGGGPIAGYVATSWDDNAIYFLDTGLNPTGSFPFGSTNANGIATDGNTIWAGTFTPSNTVFAYDLGGNPLYNWNDPNAFSLQGMEIVDGELAIQAGGEIRYYDPVTGAFNGTIPSPASTVEGLAYDGTNLYALETDTIFALDPNTGSVNFSYANPAAGEPFGGTGFTSIGGGELAIGATSGNWFIIDAATGAVNMTGNNGIDMFGLKALAGEAPCYPDCNEDGELNILDFVCFQGRFQNGDDYADCNGDGQLNILDFVCFQEQFQAGCP